LVALEQVGVVEAVEQTALPPLLVLFHRLAVEVALEESKVVLLVDRVVVEHYLVEVTLEPLGKVMQAVVLLGM
jgi:hypothetical protein